MDPAVHSVEVVFESVQLRRLGEDGQTWVTGSQLALGSRSPGTRRGRGRAERRWADPGGPIDEGRYDSVAIEFSDAYVVVHGEGETSTPERPGMALYIEDSS